VYQLLVSRAEVGSAGVLTSARLIEWQVIKTFVAAETRAAIVNRQSSRQMAPPAHPKPSERHRAGIHPGPEREP
jgi:hypothetical protein